MKNNILQKMMLALFTVSALFAITSVSAYKCQPSDFLGSCGHFDEDDVRIGLEIAAAAKPDVRKIEEIFLEVTTNPWRPGFECYVFSSWPFWNEKQKQAIIDHMYTQGMISTEQVENWQNSPYPPCVEPDRERVGG